MEDNWLSFVFILAVNFLSLMEGFVLEIVLAWTVLGPWLLTLAFLSLPMYLCMYVCICVFDCVSYYVSLLWRKKCLLVLRVKIFCVIVLVKLFHLRAGIFPMTENLFC